MKRNLLKLTALLLTASLGVCAVNIPKTAVSAKTSSATIENSEMTVFVGNKNKIRLNKKAKGAKYKFTSSKKTVAKVNKKGIIKGVSEGNAKITVKEIKDGKKTKVGTVKVTVEKLKSLAECDNFKDSFAAFSVDLFKNTCLEDIKAGKNTLVSPESVVSALMLLDEGCKGETYEELTKALAGGVTFEDYRDGLVTFNKKLTSSEKIKFHIANSVWVRDDENFIRLNDDYVENVKKYYNAGIFPRAFDDSTTKEINDWVSDNTDGMIPEIIGKIDKSTAAMLINALCFEGKWPEEYKDTVEKDFTNAAGETETANMLCGTEYLYISDDNAVGFLKNYDGGDYRFMAILPNEEIGVEEYVKNMTGETIVSLYDSISYDDVITKIPEFKYDYDADLKAPLTDMGVKKAFDPYGADLTGMGSAGLDNLYVDSVIHKTHIELDKKGTKAAAATAVVVGKTTSVGPTEPPKEVILDRPFIYAIVETETGLPVFMGVVNSVK